MKRAWTIGLALAALAVSAWGQDFYKGRTVELYIGYSVGGGYDIYARLLARHLGRHLPGRPVVVPKNREGAGSLRLANWLAKAAPRDGTVFGTIGRGIAFDPLLGAEGTQFNASEFGWLGSANDEVSVCAAWGTSGISRFEDLYARPDAPGHRLPWRKRHHARDAARRGRGALRLVLVEHQDQSSAMGERWHHQAARAALAR